MKIMIFCWYFGKILWKYIASGYIWELLPHREILKLRPTRESVFARIIVNIGINAPQDAPMQISIKGQTEKISLII